MHQFQNLKQLLADFTHNRFSLEGIKSLMISDQQFDKVVVLSHDFDDIQTHYGLHAPIMKFENKDSVITLVWKCSSASIIPAGISFKYKDSNSEDHALDDPLWLAESTEEPPPQVDEVRGSHADVTTIEFMAPFIDCKAEAKVDTGADMCSLDAQSISVSGTSVTFISTILSPNKLTVDLVTTTTISSADGGIQNRPVVEFDITIEGKLLSAVKFNLNDRSEMQHKVLIGQNALEQGAFMVDTANNKLVSA